MTDAVLPSSSARFKLGRWDVTPSERRIGRGDISKVLSPRAMDVLVHLARRSNDVVSSAELLEAHWPRSVRSANAVHKIITELRHAFGEEPHGDVSIQTVSKRGYRLVAVASELANGTDTHAPSNGDAHAPTLDFSQTRLANGSKARQRWSSRKVMVFSSLAAALVVIGWSISTLSTQRATVVVLGNHSAVLLPVADTLPGAIRQGFEDLPDQVVAHFRMMGATVHDDVKQVRRDTNVAHAWDVDYAVTFDARDEGQRLEATLAIVPALASLPSHREAFSFPEADRKSFRTKMVEHAIDDLTVLLDDAHLERMRSWGTQNPDAYLLARKGDEFQRIQTVASNRRAEQMFRKALEVDPKFPYAYGSLSAVYWAIGQTPADLAEREGTRQDLLALRRDARTAITDSAALDAIDQALQFVSIGSASDAEQVWRKEIINNPHDSGAMRWYARVLMGAKLLDESEAYIDRAIAEARSAGSDDVSGLQSEYVTLYTIRRDFETQVELVKDLVDRVNPDFTLSLYGLVQCLSKLGRFTEAEAYLERLKRTDEKWGYNAGVYLRVHRGDIRPHSPELQAALADPLVTHSTKSDVCFILGDVDCGTEELLAIEPEYAWLRWHFNPAQEAYFAANVVSDPRYQKTLEALGVGKAWRADVRRGAEELSAITGIGVTTPPPPEDRSY